MGQIAEKGQCGLRIGQKHSHMHPKWYSFIVVVPCQVPGIVPYQGMIGHSSSTIAVPFKATLTPKVFLGDVLHAVRVLCTKFVQDPTHGQGGCGHVFSSHMRQRLCEGHSIGQWHVSGYPPMRHPR